MSAPAKPPLTTILQGPSRAVSLGEWCVQRGLVTREQVDQCLSHQKELVDRGQKAPRLGELLLERGYIPLAGLLKALASQRREIRHCPRCRFQTTVPVGAPAGLHACAGCSGPLVLSPDIAGQDDFVAAPSRDALPDEVRQASHRPGSRFGKYILVRELGSGGVGRVSLAWDPFLSQYVAVKRLIQDLPDKSEDAINERRRMLLQEARSAIRLRHPGIVSVYDVGRIGDDPYISMEFVDGMTLHDRLQGLIRAGAPSPFAAEPRAVLGLLAEVARALEYAHTKPQPLIHCDLKPSNVMIGRDGHARVLDFGLARNLKSDAPPEESEFISGTPAYMSPEQCRGDLAHMDARTDVYALGAILYECLTGRTPFIGSAFEILHLTMNASPERPSTALAARLGKAPEGGARIPDALESLCMACLERDPQRRPSSLADVAATLEAVLAGPPATPAPKPTTMIVPTSLSPRPSSGRRLLLTGALLLALLGLGFLPIAFAFLSEPRDLGRFQPEQARSLLPDRQEEIEAVRDLKSRLIDALHRAAPRIAELRLRGGLPVAVTALTGADAAGLKVRTSGGPADIAWEALEPRQIVALVQIALPDATPNDRLGLAVYCLRAGLPDDARRLLESLRGSACAPQAERYFHEVNP